MFFGGALQSIAVMVWWLVELVTRYGIVGHPMTWAIAPSAAHAYLMIYGLFPFFMFGFLMTVFPRWMNGQEIPARYYVPAFILMMLGAAGFYVGLLSNDTVLFISAASTLAGWGIAAYALLRVLLDTQHPDKQHPKAIFLALSLGWCSQASYLVWLASDREVFLHVAIQGGLWLFLLPVFASAGHRMIPFFTSSALPQHVVKRSYWPWWVLLMASAVHGLLQLSDLSNWFWVCDIPLACVALHLTYGWGVHRSMRIPLLSVLHIGFLWMGIAMLLSSIQSVVSFISDGDTLIWGFAPLHALTIGCFATLLIGFGTRVTLGHSGLPMQVDKPVTLMFAGIQLAALVRVLADMLPIQIRYWLYVSASVIWLASFSLWALRYLPVYIQPRVDGRAG
jgi:uncharacterized protein involved in response to NO